MNHYVYGLEDISTGEFYIGVRSCECNPKSDKYMGSYQRWNPNISDLNKYIIREFTTRKEANSLEKKLIEKNINNSLNRNYCIPPLRFHRLGLSHTKEAIQKIVKYANNRPKRHTRNIKEAKMQKVKQLSTGKVFDSINDAADYFDVSYATIGRRLDDENSDLERLGDKIEYSERKDKRQMHPNANITKEKAQEVLTLINNTNLSPKQIQKRTNVDYQTIKDMKYKGRYSWVLDE